MITSYIFILALSAWLIAFAMLHVARRIYTILGTTGTPAAGVVALASAVLFLTVVAAPSAMLTGVVVVTFTQWLHTRYPLPKLAVWGIPLLAAFFSVDPAHLPLVAASPRLAQALGVAILFGVFMGHRALPYKVEPYGLVVLCCLLPTLAAPLFTHLPYANSMALDSAIIAAAFLGALMATVNHAPMGLARAPFALLLGWLMLQPAMYGAWPFTIASLLIYGGFIAYGFTQHYSEHDHA